MNAEPRILEPGRMERPLGEIPLLFLPGRDLFARRAGRFRLLSEDHPLRDYLSFLATLSYAQHRALDDLPSVSGPGPGELARCGEQGMALLDARLRPRDPVWRLGLSLILEQMRDAGPTAAQETVAGLIQANETGLEERADKILAGDLAGISPRELPFVAAALQVYWVKMASSLRGNALGKPELGGVCPVCGSHPMAGIVRGGGAEQGLRYLYCSLCSSQWHMVRIKCSSCESTEGIDYYALEGSDGAVKAESCGKCNSYLKLLYLGKDPQMEATADDLATLAVDMLMDRKGKWRGGPNLFFHPGR